MLTAFKLLSWKVKLGIFAGILVLMAALVGSTYYIAYNKGLNVSAVEIANYEKDLAKLEGDLARARAEVDVRVVTDYVTRTETIKGDTIRVVDTITEYVPIQEEFRLSSGWVNAYNSSVTREELSAQAASDTTPATLTNPAILAIIAENNGIAHENAQKLTSLQEWIRGNQNAVETVNNNAGN